MRTRHAAFTILALLSIPAIAADIAPAEKAASEQQASADVTLMAAWIAGAGDAHVFDEPFAAAKSLAEAQEVFFYSDVANMRLPTSFQRVTYDFIAPRLRAGNGGNWVGPAVAITRTIDREPVEPLRNQMQKDARIASPGERFYYIEAAITKDISARMKLRMFEADGQTQAEILYAENSGKMREMRARVAPLATRPASRPAAAPAADVVSPADKLAAADVSLLAAWIAGEADAKIFENPFGDHQWITNAKDPIFYTDVQRVTVPKHLRPAPFDFIEARMETVRTGNKASPAVLITDSVAGYAKGGVLEGDPQRVEKGHPGERYYYIEVAIGNMAWHWIKMGVYEEDGKTKVELMQRAVS